MQQPRLVRVDCRARYRMVRNQVDLVRASTNQGDGEDSALGCGLDIQR